MKKVTSSHTSLITEARFIVEKAKKLHEVSKIVIGEIASIRVSSRRIKFIPVPAGWRVTVRGINARQILFIYTKEPEGVKNIISAAWGSKWKT